MRSIRRVLRNRLPGRTRRFARSMHHLDRSTDYVLDIGMHKGFDAEYYLRKGFRVVGVEPRSDLIRIAERRLWPFVQNGSLEIIGAAVDHEAGRVVDFWIHPTKDDWGSLDRHHAEKGTAEATRIHVPTTSISEIFSRYGTPYLLKSDTEGGEDIVLASLVDQAQVPIHLSFEICTPTQLDLLLKLPYKRFQIRNQWMNPWIVERAPSLEGLTNPTTFTHEHSGPFGKDLPDDMWMDSSELRRRIDHWFALSEVDRTLVGNGWLDIHCSLSVI